MDGWRRSWGFILYSDIQIGSDAKGGGRGASSSNSPVLTQAGLGNEDHSGTRKDEKLAHEDKL